VVGVAAGVRPGTAELADEHGRGGRVELGPRQLGVVLERGVGVTSRLGLGHPELHAVQDAAVATRVLLGVHDAPAGGHQVELAGADHLLRAEAVVVEHLPGEQPGHRLETDVRMWADVDALFLRDARGAHVIDEAPGADAAAGSARQRPAHDERADDRLVALGDLDARRSRVGTGGLGGGVVGRHRTAHGRSLHPSGRVPQN
jgi:hypothetical protein